MMRAFRIYCPSNFQMYHVAWSAIVIILSTTSPAAAAAAKSLQSCLPLCNPIDGSPPGSPVPGILQARILEWVAISFSRGSSQPRNRTQVSRIVADSLPSEPPGKPKYVCMHVYTYIYVKAMVFPVVMYGCDSWTIKKAESWRIDAFERWCWRRLLRVHGLQGDPTSPS